MTVEPTEITEETAFITVMVEVPVNTNLWLKPIWFKCETIKSQVTLKCERPPMVTLTGLPALKARRTRVNLRNRDYEVHIASMPDTAGMTILF